MDTYPCPKCGHEAWTVRAFNDVKWDIRCPDCGYCEEL